MSASSKKKLRRAEQAEKMTEKQLAEQKEAKKLKLYTTMAVVVLIALLAFAAYSGISRAITSSGIRERSTIALTIGEHEISNAELNYFYTDAINKFVSQYGSYASWFGLDMTLPLNEQIYDQESGTTWADNFLESAISNAKSVYALADEANAKGFTLPEESVADIDSAMASMDAYAAAYGYTNTSSYLKAMYGNGATVKSLRAYFETTELAGAYQQHYYDSLTYSDEELRAADQVDPRQYNAYTYNYYYLSVNSFLETADDAEPTVAQKAAALEAAREAAESLTTDINTVEAFDAAIAALPINAENTSAASTLSEGYSYSKINSLYADWITSDDRKAGDMTFIASTSTNTDENGKETETVNGYYVLLFGSMDTNEFSLVNVRHILVSFEGGTYDSTTGVTTYTDEEKLAAKEAAEAILNEWKAGTATEDSFAALANERSDDGDGTTGGLYEDIRPGQMVSAFEDWCFAGHKVGDTGIVETQYGYHVMFYSGDSDLTYRDYLITEALASADYESWYTALVEGAAATKQDIKYLNMGLVLSAS